MFLPVGLVFFTPKRHFRTKKSPFWNGQKTIGGHSKRMIRQTRAMLPHIGTPLLTGYRALPRVKKTHQRGIARTTVATQRRRERRINSTTTYAQWASRPLGQRPALLQLWANRTSRRCKSSAKCSSSYTHTRCTSSPNRPR